MKFGSVCSGIEAVSQAWFPLGATPVFYSEIEPFPSAVLAERHPEVPNLGDMLEWRSWPEDLLASIDVLVGGTPCQSFSIAGLRESLDDERGNLALEFIRIANAADDIRRHRGLGGISILWENVPGVFSTKDNAFGTFLGALVGSDAPIEKPASGRWTRAGLVSGPQRSAAWRVLDAQHFGVAQRRRRVFVVASPRDGRNPAEILFEPEGVRRDSPPSREAWQENTGGPASGIGLGCAKRATVQPYDVANCLTERMHKGINTTLDEGQTPIIEKVFSFPANANGDEMVDAAVGKDCAPALRRQKSGTAVADLRAFSFKPSHFTRGKDGQPSPVCPPLSADADKGDQDPVLFAGPKSAESIAENQRGELRTNDVITNINAKGGKPGQGYPAILEHEEQAAGCVRRLTPVECERLQGFPDNFTQIPWRKKAPENCPDGPRYRALGNSMAVPVIRWIGERLMEDL